MKNKVQFQKGYSLLQFLKEYGTEEQYRKALFKSPVLPLKDKVGKKPLQKPQL